MYTIKYTINIGEWCYEKEEKNPLLIIVLLVLAIGIGYAYLNSNLALNGSTGISGNEWDVHFESLTYTKSAGTTCTQTPRIDPNNNTKFIYNCSFDLPGDYIEITVKAVNDGTIDVMINDARESINGVEFGDVPYYFLTEITYNDGILFNYYQTLPANATHTLVFHMGYDQNINPDELPDTDDSVDIELEIIYTQADENAVPRTREIYTCNNKAQDNIEFQIGNMIPDNATTYNTLQELVNETGQNIFVKHVMAGPSIQKSMVGIMIDGTPQYIEGGIYWENDPLTGMERQNPNKTILEEMAYENGWTCDSTSIQFGCGIFNDGANNYMLIINLNDGLAAVAKRGYCCAIEADGKSYCFENTLIFGP